MLPDPDELAARIRARRERIACEIDERLRRARNDPRWPPHARLGLFGSRACGRATGGSDLDLVVFGQLSRAERDAVDRLLREHLPDWPLDLLFLAEAPKEGRPWPRRQDWHEIVPEAQRFDSATRAQ